MPFLKSIPVTFYFKLIFIISDKFCKIKQKIIVFLDTTTVLSKLHALEQGFLNSFFKSPLFENLKT